MCVELSFLLYSCSLGVCECVCVLAKEGEGDRDEEKDRNKDPSVSAAHKSLPFYSESQGTRARDNSLVAALVGRTEVTPINSNNSSEIANVRLVGPLFWSKTYIELLMPKLNIHLSQF